MRKLKNWMWSRISWFGWCLCWLIISGLLWYVRILWKKINFFCLLILVVIWKRVVFLNWWCLWNLLNGWMCCWYLKKFMILFWIRISFCCWWVVIWWLWLKLLCNKYLVLMLWWCMVLMVWLLCWVCKFWVIWKVFSLFMFLCWLCVNWCYRFICR